MMKKAISAALAGAAAFSLLHGAAIPGIPRDSNNLNTGNYDATRVETQLLVQVGEKTKKIHFVRDNNDPRVITKTYLIRHVNAYEFRDYLRQMVQSKRVGNSSLVQQYPGNTAATASVRGETVTLPAAATAASPVLSGANAQPGFNPSVQLGSNTAVECLQYVDGTGLLIVSAEDYRFRDHPNGMGIDSLVAMLDDPALGAIGTGSQMFIYMPKYVPARNLMPLLENLGMNGSDATELWQGQDIVAYDPELNWLIFDVANYSCDNIAHVLAKFDVPVMQARLKITVLQIDRENDDKIGLDFQNWKNNQGADLFSAGGRYRNNWNALYDTTGLNRAAGSERTSFYNFNPKWNTRYLDFLTAVGKARVTCSGELVIRNASEAALDRTTRIFYIDSSEPVPGTTGETLFPNTGVGPYELLHHIIGSVSGRTDFSGDPVRVGKGNQQITTQSAGYGFTLKVSAVSVNRDETRFQIELNNSSLIGFQSNGAPRIASGNTVTQTVSLPHGTRDFIIGGLKKSEKVTSRTGIPYLMDIPYLGWIFGSESTSVKSYDLIVTGQCQLELPDYHSEGASSKRYRKGLPIPSDQL